MARILGFVLTLILFFLFLPQLSFASENFATDYKITYTVQENGVTRAHLAITLTNTTTEYYAANYKIQVGFSNIANIQASDEGGRIRPTVTKNEEGQQIELTFNKNVVGQGNKLNFSVSFDTAEIANKSGKIWEINIPGISSNNDFSSFAVEVKVPDSFGSPMYIKPRQENNSLVFHKEQLEDTGISLAFGEKQLYSFRLTYHLRNKNVFPIQTEIAIPPTTNYQEVFIQSMTPQPENVTIDRDGNWLATYHLLPSQNVDVSVRGKAEVYLYPKSEPLSESEKSEYLKPLENWSISEQRSETTALDTPEKVYDFVVKTLTYDFSRVTTNAERLGAQGVLSEPSSAVCREFTDLFIALARQAGIPAREVNGYAHTQNTKQRPLSLVRDILHAWPEYYDESRNTWVMVDPTWGNTTNGVDYFHTLDFDHLTFVRKGLDSEYPIPAGGYKYPGDERKKDVEVTFADTTPQLSGELSVRTSAQPEYIAGFPMSATARFTNTGQSLTPQQRVLVNAGTLSPLESDIRLDPIPPYGYREVVIGFAKTSLLTNLTDRLTITINGKTFQQNVHAVPLYLTKWAAFGGVFIGILAIIIFVIAKRARRVPVSR